MQMRRENNINEQLVKDGHPHPADLLINALTALRASLNAVLQYILVHEDDIPLLAVRLQIAADPRELLLDQPALKAVDLLLLRAEHDIVRLPVVKGVVVPPERLAPVARRPKVVQIRDGKSRLPLAVIGLVVPHDRRHRDHALHLIHALKELRPLIAILAVVHEVAEAGEKCCIRIACPCEMRHLLPVCIVARLAVGKEQHLVRQIGIGRHERQPCRRSALSCDAIAVLHPRHELIDLHQVLMHRHIVVGKRSIHGRKPQHIIHIGCLHLKHLSGGFLRRLPHDDATAAGILRDDLPQALHVEAIRKGIESHPLQPLHQRIVSEHRAARENCTCRHRPLDKGTAREAVLFFSYFFPFFFHVLHIFHFPPDRRHRAAPCRPNHFIVWPTLPSRAAALPAHSRTRTPRTRACARHGAGADSVPRPHS